MMTPKKFTLKPPSLPGSSSSEDSEEDEPVASISSMSKTNVSNLRNNRAVAASKMGRAASKFGFAADKIKELTRNLTGASKMRMTIGASALRSGVGTKM